MAGDVGAQSAIVFNDALIMIDTCCGEATRAIVDVLFESNRANSPVEMM